MIPQVIVFPPQNTSEQTQQIVLWEEHGEKFDEQEIIKKSQQGVVVAIFAGLTTGKYLGKSNNFSEVFIFHLTTAANIISTTCAGKYEASSSSATKVYIDMELPEVIQYRTRQLMITFYLYTLQNHSFHNNFSFL
jgi:replication factor A1